MEAKWIKCRDIERTDRSVWLRGDQVRAVSSERIADATTWAVHVDVPQVGLLRYGGVLTDRDKADQMAASLVGELGAVVAPS